MPRLGNITYVQPRVPGGSGSASGQWTAGAGDAVPAAVQVTARAVPQSRLPIVSVAADGPFQPGGMNVYPPGNGIDPLDPAKLNGVLGPEEQQAIASTVNAIIAAKPEDLPTPNPRVQEHA